MIISSMQEGITCKRGLYNLSKLNYQFVSNHKNKPTIVKTVDIVFCEDKAILTKEKKSDGEIIKQEISDVSIDKKLVDEFTLRVVRLIGDAIKCDEIQDDEKEYLNIEIDQILKLHASLALTNGHKYLKELVLWFFDKAKIQTL